MHLGLAEEYIAPATDADEYLSAPLDERCSESLKNHCRKVFVIVPYSSRTANNKTWELFLAPMFVFAKIK